MAEQKIDELKISEEEANAVRISNSADRPNAFSSYRESKKTAADVKKMFDAPFELLRAKHDKSVDELRKYNAAESEREAAETEREEAETKRANAEQERKTAEITRDEKIDEFYEAYESGKLKGDKGEKGDPGSVNVVQIPGDSEADAMSQKASSNAFSNALKGSVSGTNAVVLTNVSPNPQTIKIKASSDSVADITTVKLLAQGKNLIEPNVNTFGSSYGGQTTVEDDVFTTNFENGGIHVNSYKRVWFRAGTYTLTIIPVSERVACVVFLYDKSSDGILVQKSIDTKEQMQYTFTATSDFYLCLAGIYNNPCKSSYRLQLALGSSGEYERYVAPTEYAVNEKGEVENLKPIYPTTTLTTDVDGITLEATYNKDINKAFAELVNAIIALGGNV